VSKRFWQLSAGQALNICKEQSACLSKAQAEKIYHLLCAK